MMRPLLVGMNNPLSRVDDHALYPWPEGCTGHRLWQMLLPMTDDEYLEKYERCNLVEGRAWSTAAAKAAAPAMRERMRLRRTIILGREVRDIMGWREAVVAGAWLALPESRTGSVMFLPHPSGRNLWYNDPKNRLTARRILLEALT